MREELTILKEMAIGIFTHNTLHENPEDAHKNAQKNFNMSNLPYTTLLVQSPSFLVVQI